MAMDYEVRPEYRDVPLEELLDTTVMCFQGVGDTQNEILQRFFGVTTVGDLANMPFFLSSLGIQELALREEGNGQRPVGELAQHEGLRFRVRPEYNDDSAKELLASPVRVLDELTPAQSLALYDGFRITTVLQLAHNRIMLEARIIEYLKKVQAGEIPEADMQQQISSILLSSATPPPAGAAGVGESDLGAMAGDLHSHLRGRLDDLRSRARERASEVAARPTTSAEERSEEAARVRPDQATDGRSRLDTIREMRQRGDAASASSLGTRTSVAQNRAAMMEEMRARRGSATTERSPTGSAFSRLSTTGSRPSPARPAGGTATATAAGTAGAAGAAATAGTAEAGAADAAAAAATVEAPTARPRRRTVRRRSNAPQLLIAAAAALVLIVGGIWIYMSATEEPASMSSEMQPAQGTPQGAQPGDAADQRVAGGAAQSPASGQAAEREVPPGGRTADGRAVVEMDGRRMILPIKSIHTVVWGQSLWRISRARLNDPELWPWIYQANQTQIDDPDLIYPDQKFDIPEVQ